MRVRSWRLFAAALVVSTAIGWALALPAGAATRITYSGQSVAVRATVSSSTTVLADTGSLPTSGGALEASSVSAVVPQSVTADTLHATTIGQGDRTRSEASVANIVTAGGANTLAADLVLSRTMAVSQGNRASVTGSSHVSNLVVNGASVVVTGQANQTISLIDGQLIINEQISSVVGDAGSITVNALHLTINGGSDVVLGSSTAGVVAAQQNCSSTNDFTTGGGSIVPPTGGPKRTFGIVGGVRTPPFEGHLVYVNHATNERVQGRVTLYLILPGTARHMEGIGEVNGVAANFQVDVSDNGEPGTSDTFSVTYQTANSAGADSGTLEGGNIQLHLPCR